MKLSMSRIVCRKCNNTVEVNAIADKNLKIELVQAPSILIFCASNEQYRYCVSVKKLITNIILNRIDDEYEPFKGYIHYYYHPTNFFAFKELFTMK